MQRVITFLLLLIASPVIAAISVVPDHVTVRDTGESQTVYFTITDDDGTSYKWHGVTPVLSGQDLQKHLNDKKRDLMCGVYRKMWRDAVVEDKPDKDCYADWRNWIDAGAKNVTTTTVGLTKSQWKDKWRTDNTKELERTKGQATDKIQIDIDDPDDNGTEVVVGYQLDDNGDGTITEVKQRVKRKVKTSKLQLKDGCRFSPGDGKFYCLVRPSGDEAEAAAATGWTPPVTESVSVVVPKKTFKATW